MALADAFESLSSEYLCAMNDISSYETHHVFLVGITRYVVLDEYLYSFYYEVLRTLERAASEGFKCLVTRRSTLENHKIIWVEEPVDYEDPVFLHQVILER